MKNMFYFYLKPNKLLGQPSTYMDDLQLSDILRFFFLRQNQGEQLLKHFFTKLVMLQFTKNRMDFSKPLSFPYFEESEKNF